MVVVPETEMIPHREVEATVQANHGASASGAGESHHPFPSLGRQSSIYSLTLDEFQHALCESGRNFGSMNMDEFLVSIWNAEENQQAAVSQAVPANGNGFNNVAIGERVESGVVGSAPGDTSHGKRGITKQPSLSRQGSLTLPAPLCRKTVDEVWSEIHRGQLGSNNDGGESNGNGNNSTQNAENAARQPTFGEMTLEDFLIKAGVVREQTGNLKPNPNPNQTPVMPAAAQQQHYGMFQGAGGPGFPAQSMAVGDSSGFMNNGKRTGGGYAPAMPTQPAVCYGGRVPTSAGVGAGGYVPSQQVGMVGPVSPVSSDGLGHGQVDNMGGQFGVDISALRGRKRTGDGPVEKVVERRQRRMIKNRESAARSRARKQAYTVELEAELNQLKEENAQLKHALAELERKRKQQYSEDTRPQSKAQKAKDRLRTLRRNTSCPL